MQTFSLVSPALFPSAVTSYKRALIFSPTRKGRALVRPAYFKKHLALPSPWLWFTSSERPTGQHSGSCWPLDKSRMWANVWNRWPVPTTYRRHGIKCWRETRSLQIKETWDKQPYEHLALIWNLIFQANQPTIKKVSTDWEKIFAKFTSDEKLLSKIYKECWNLTIRKWTGVPIVAQQKWIWLVSMRMQVQSLASPSGLRIQPCHELWCGSQTWLRSGIAVVVV